MFRAFGHRSARSTIPPRSRSTRARGFTLLELILVLSVGSMITLLSFQSMKRNYESTQASAVGLQMKILGTAVDNYISNRYTQISQLTNSTGLATDPGPRTCSAATKICTITVTTLVNEGLLPNNYKNANSYASPYSIVLTVGGTAPNLLVNGMVTTTNPWTVGGVVRYDLLGQAMQAAGPDSGMTRASATQIDGYSGIWDETSATFSNINTLGQLGFRAGYGSALYSVYLRRDGTLPMTGDLSMNDGVTAHNITGASNITGSGALTMGQLYANYESLSGSLAVAGSETVAGNITANGSIGASGDVTAGLDLIAARNLGVTGTAYITTNEVVGGNSTVGSSTVNGSQTVAANDVVQGSIYGGYVQSNGTAYVASTFNVGGSAGIAGNMSVNQGVYTNYLQSNGAGYIGNGLTVVNGENLASGNLAMSNGAEISNSGTAYYEAAGNLYLKPFNGNGITVVGGGGGSGQLLATGSITTNQYLIPQGGASVGAGCAPSGEIGTDGTRPLFCQNGVWASAGSSSHVTQYGMPGGVQGTWSIGLHNYCALAEYDSYQNVVPEVYITSGANASGQYQWAMSTTGNGGSYGTAFECWDFN